VCTLTAPMASHSVRTSDLKPALAGHRSFGYVEWMNAALIAQQPRGY
jgi:hypothetical protein